MCVCARVCLYVWEVTARWAFHFLRYQNIIDNTVLHPNL